MKKLRKNRKAFVLLLVLAVLVIASTVLASWAYRISISALNASEVSRDIQRKWAELSCQSAIIASAEDILNEDSKESKDGQVASAVREVKLSGMTYRLVLFDEQAKANVNFLLKNNNRQYVLEQLRQLMFDMKNQPQILLGTDTVNIEYVTLEQLFDSGVDPEKLMEISRLTCFGSGLLNFNRADKKTLSAVGTGILNDIDIEKIMAVRKEKPEGSLDELIKQLSLDDKNSAKIKKYLTDKSACKSLWVICNDTTRNWYRLYITLETTENDKTSSKTWSYRW